MYGHGYFEPVSKTVVQDYLHKNSHRELLPDGTLRRLRPDTSVPYHDWTGRWPCWKV